MLTIVVLAFNEEKYLNKTINSVVGAATIAGNVPLDIIIVNDGSRDTTAQIIQQLEAQYPFIRSIHHVDNKGPGVGVKEAIAIARYPRFTVLPGDNDLSQELLAQLFSDRDKADLVLAYYLNDKQRGSFRSGLSKLYTFIYQKTFNVSIQYINSACIYPTEKLRCFNIRSNRFGYAAEMTIKMLSLGCSFYEIPGHRQQVESPSRSISFKSLYDVVVVFLGLVVEIKIAGRKHFNRIVKGGQTPTSADKNAKFFLNGYQTYREHIESIDTYALISSALSGKLQGIRNLLDVGNGGIFDYDTRQVGKIVGLDLFLDQLHKDICLPSNVKMVQGSALDIPKNLHDFDGVVVVMLIHHLVGRTVKDCLANTQQLLAEARRVLRSGGKLVIMESCVPAWFFVFEKIFFVPATMVIEKTMQHPSTLQYSADFLFEMIEKAGFTDVQRENVPKGKYVLQYGIKVPSWITPIQPVLFSALRP